MFSLVGGKGIVINFLLQRWFGGFPVYILDEPHDARGNFQFIPNLAATDIEITKRICSSNRSTKPRSSFLIE
jgi:hypothetical protein